MIHLKYPYDTGVHKPCMCRASMACAFQSSGTTTSREIYTRCNISYLLRDVLTKLKYNISSNNNSECVARERRDYFVKINFIVEDAIT
jgi:hypothetical protein